MILLVAGLIACAAFVAPRPVPVAGWRGSAVHGRQTLHRRVVAMRNVVGPSTAQRQYTSRKRFTVVGGGAVCGWWLGGAVGAAVGAAASVVALRVARTRVKQRADTLRNHAFLVHVQSAAAMARAGGDGVKAISTENTQLTGVVTDLHNVWASTDIDRGLRDWSTKHNDVDGVSDVALALALARRTGAPLAELLDVVASTIRHRRASAAELHALSAQARASSTIVGVAPLLFVGVATTIDERLGSMLLGSPVGWVTLSTAAALNVGGLLWMRRIAGLPQSSQRADASSGRARLVAAAAVMALGTTGFIQKDPLLIGIAGVGVWVLTRGRRATPATPQAELDLATTADRMKLCIAAGMSPSDALDAVGSLGTDPTSNALDLAWRRWRLGDSLDASLAQAEADTYANVAPLIASLRVDVRFGGPLHDRLRDVANDARQRARRASEVHARTASVRMLIPLACCVLPAFALVLLVPTVAVAVETIRGIGTAQPAL